MYNVCNKGSKEYWNPEDKMPMETISTLVTSFKYDIFLQKSVLEGSGEPSDTWLDETMSCSIEYLLSSKIHTNIQDRFLGKMVLLEVIPISDGQLPDF